MNVKVIFAALTDMKLNSQREILYLRAPMYYLLLIREVFVIKVLDMTSDE